MLLLWIFKVSILRALWSFLGLWLGDVALLVSPHLHCCKTVVSPAQLGPGACAIPTFLGSCPHLWGTVFGSLSWRVWEHSTNLNSLKSSMVGNAGGWPHIALYYMSKEERCVHVFTNNNNPLLALPVLL